MKMPITQRIPNPIAPLSTEGLVKLISAPQKAAELWQVYTQHREAYEVLRASIAAEQASLEKRAVEYKEIAAGVNIAEEMFRKERAAFLEEKAVWTKQRNAVEDGLASKSAALTALDAALNSRGQNLDQRKFDMDVLEAHRNSIYDEHMSQLNAFEDELEAREVAVALREKKAEELAKLLKEV